MNRPYITCHMTTSLDGKVTGKFLSSAECEDAIDAYYKINRDFQADAFACGRITMAESFTGDFYPDLYEYATIELDREDFIADNRTKFFAVSFDRFGRLGWQSSRIHDSDPGYDNAHIIQVLTEAVPDEYLNYLRLTGISYIFAGEFDIDLNIALEKLKRYFGIEHLLLEGGSILNGSFEREGLIDELSLVVAPVTGSAEDMPLFDNGISDSFTLVSAEPAGRTAVWLRYKK